LKFFGSDFHMLTHFCCWGEAKKRRKTTVTKGVGTCSKGEETCLATLNSVSYQTHSPPADKFIMTGFDKIHSFWKEETPPHYTSLTLTSLAMSSLSSWPE
jgi:hypothetical protein